MRIAVEIISGNSSGWRCTQVAYVVGHVAGYGDVQLVAAIPQEDKDQLLRDAEKMRRGAAYFTLIARTARQFGPDPVAQLIEQAATAAALGAAYAQAYLEAAALDPWDDYYNWPYDAPVPSAEQLGLERCAGESTAAIYCNVMIDMIQHVAQNGDGAYVSLNRSGTCAQIPGSDCAQWQAERAYAYLHLMGDYMRWAGWTFAVLREEYSYNGQDLYSPECDCPLTWVLNEASNDFWNSGSYLMNRF